MKKTIFVVEGQTEQIFTQIFISKLASVLAYSVISQKLHSGQLLKVTQTGVPEEVATHQILIINVEGDEKVPSYIRDNVSNFKNKGYSAIFGLRDAYTGDGSKPKVNVDALYAAMNEIQVDEGIRTDLVVALQEVEAWFLSAPEFFEALDDRLSIEKINSTLDIDLCALVVEDISHPAKLINDVLAIVGRKYKKRAADSHSISQAMNYDSLYFVSSEKINSLKKYIGFLEESLS